jgi:hypothetical protein
MLWKIAAWRKIDTSYHFLMERIMEIFLNEKGILTHISRPLAELQEEFRLTGNENQENENSGMPRENWKAQENVTRLTGRFSGWRS